MTADLDIKCSICRERQAVPGMPGGFLCAECALGRERAARALLEGEVAALRGWAKKAEPMFDSLWEEWERRPKNFNDAQKKADTLTEMIGALRTWAALARNLGAEEK